MRPWSAAALGLLFIVLAFASGCLGYESGEEPRATETSQSPTPTPAATERPADTPHPDEELSNYSREAAPALPPDRFVSVERAHRWHAAGNATLVDGLRVLRRHRDGVVAPGDAAAFGPERGGDDGRVSTHLAGHVEHSPIHHPRLHLKEVGLKELGPKELRTQVLDGTELKTF